MGSDVERSIIEPRVTCQDTNAVICSTNSFKSTVNPGLFELAPVKFVLENVTPINVTERFPDTVLERLHYGVELYQSGHYTQAIQVWNNLVQQFELINDPLHQAVTLSFLSAAFQQLNQWDEAERTITQSFALLRQDSAQANQTDWIQALARSLTTQARLDRALGNPTIALEHLKQATQLYASIGDELGNLGTQINQAHILQALGRYRQALKQLVHIEKYIENQPYEVRILALLNIGNTLREMGDLEKSWCVLNRGLLISEMLTSPEDRQIFLQLKSEFFIDLGKTAWLLGKRDQSRQGSVIPQQANQSSMKSLHEGFLYNSDQQTCYLMEETGHALQLYIDAIDYFDEAIKHSTSLEQTVIAEVNKLGVLTNLSSDNSWQNQWQKNFNTASHLWEELREELQRFNQADSWQSPNRLVTSAIIRLSEYGLLLQDWHEKITSDSNELFIVENNQNIFNYQDLELLLNMAIEYAVQLDDKQALSYALGELGHVYERSQDWVNAYQFTQEAFHLAQALNASEISYQWLWQLGRIYRNMDNRAAAIEAYSDAVNMLQEVRQNLRNTSLNLILENDLLANQLNADLQFYFQEKIEPVYRELIDLLLSPDQHQAITKKVSQADLNTAVAAYELLQQAELEMLLQCELTGFENSNVNDSSNYLVSQFQRVKLALKDKIKEVHKLSPDTAIIFPIILNDRLEIILSLPGQSLMNFKSLINQQDFESLTWELSKGLALHSDANEALERFIIRKPASEIYQLLFNDMDLMLNKTSVDKLVFLSDVALQKIPLGTLYDDDNSEYLIQKYGIATVPSFLQIKLSESKEKDFSILAAGLTYLEERNSTFSPLVAAQDEIIGIAQRFKKSTTLLDRDFTWKNLEKNLGQRDFSIIHIATHGKFGSTPQSTFLIDSNPEQALLTIDELDRLLHSQEDLRLLTLSACETAQGDDRAALGLAGMAVRSGAEGILATLFSVDDEFTAEFMQRFYQEFLNPGITKTEALRQTQIAYLETKRASIWSPYVIIGNWL